MLRLQAVFPRLSYPNPSPSASHPSLPHSFHSQTQTIHTPPPTSISLTHNFSPSTNRSSPTAPSLPSHLSTTLAFHQPASLPMEEETPSVEELITQASRLTTQPMLKLHPDPEKTNSFMKKVLVGKIVADHELHGPSVEDRLRFSWKLLFGMQIIKIQENTFRFAFESAAECRRIMIQAPWSVLGHHLVLKSWDPKITEQEMDFSSTIFWVQVHGLPLDHYTIDNAVDIGKLFEELLEYDLAGNEQAQGFNFIRLKVKLLVDEPLKTGFYMDSDHPYNRWIWFRYERLPNFCYNCGRLSHTKQTCPYEIVGNISEEERKHGIHSLGPLLRAEDKSGAGNNRRSTTKRAVETSRKPMEGTHSDANSTRYGSGNRLNLLPMPQPIISDPLEHCASATHQSPPTVTPQTEAGSKPSIFHFQASVNPDSLSPLSQNNPKAHKKRKKGKIQEWAPPKKIRLNPPFTPTDPSPMLFIQTCLNTESFFIKSPLQPSIHSPVFSSSEQRPDPSPLSTHNSDLRPSPLMPANQSHSPLPIHTSPPPHSSSPCTVTPIPDPSIVRSSSNPARSFRWKRMARQTQIAHKSPMAEEASQNRPPPSP